MWADIESTDRLTRYNEHEVETERDKPSATVSADHHERVPFDRRGGIRDLVHDPGDQITHGIWEGFVRSAA